jgi:hypothetical protein
VRPCAVPSAPGTEQLRAQLIEMCLGGERAAIQSVTAAGIETAVAGTVIGVSEKYCTLQSGDRCFTIPLVAVRSLTALLKKGEP